jgi:ribosome maturation factor RimP
VKKVYRVSEHEQAIETVTADAVIADERIIRETGLDAKVASIVEPVINTLGFRLVRVRLSGLNGQTLQIMAERPDGTMTVEDCELLSRTVAPVLDVEDPLSGKYHLEISSPGIDRPMVRKSDFTNWAGHVAKLETSIVHEGRKKFRGRIVIDEAAPDDSVVIESDQISYGNEPVVRIPFDLISDARLVLTDDLIRDALRKDKAAREGRIPGDILDGDLSEGANENTDEAGSAESETEK